MVEVVDLSFFPWGEGGPKGRMRGRYGTPENNLLAHRTICLHSRVAPSSACRHLLPAGEKGLAEISHDL